jgi:hypothetical protein
MTAAIRKYRYADMAPWLAAGSAPGVRPDTAILPLRVDAAGWGWKSSCRAGLTCGAVVAS